MRPTQVPDENAIGAAALAARIRQADHRNGIPLLPTNLGQPAVTLKVVNALRDDT